MTRNHLPHPRLPLKEYQAFEYLLGQINLQRMGGFTSFGELAEAVSPYMCEPGKRNAPEVLENGIAYLILDGNKFEVSRDQLKSFGPMAEEYLRANLGHYLYAFALDKATRDGKAEAFVDNMYVDIVFDPAILMPTFTFSVRLFFPYEPVERPVYVMRGDGQRWG